MTEIDDMRIPVAPDCTLSARVWMPQSAADHPLPAILEILPYRKRDGTAARDATTHAVFAQSGYVCVRVDLRGTGQSDGLFDDEYSEQELSDVETTIAWIAAQPWCSGAVGIMGISWGGFNGLQVAARRPSALKAVISCCSSVDRFADDIHFKGGCQLTENIGWAATAMSWFSMPPDPAQSPNWREIWMERLDATPFLASRWITHGQRDDYWRHGSVCEDFSAITAPVLAIGGWHDGYRNTPAKLLEGGTSGPVKAILGPWNHKYPHLATPGPQIDFIAEALRWWDHWLKGIDRGVDADPAARIYLMDGIAPATSYAHRPGRWIALPDWPSAHIQPVRFTLGDDATLGAGALSAPATIQPDPLSGQMCGEYFPYGFGPGELPDDQRTDDARALCFDTAPLTAPLDLVGAADLTLTLSCSAPEGQIVARLCEIAPDGASTLISFGLLDLQFADGFDAARPVQPNAPVTLSLPFDQAAYRVRAGHRLRLAISPSYWPFIWPSPQPGALTISSGQITLPVLDGAAALHTDLAPPPTQPDLPVRLSQPGHEEKYIQTDGPWHTIVITADHGETEHLGHGLATRSALSEQWSINTQDINQARATINWTRGLRRNDIDVSTQIVATLYSDATSLYVVANLKAYEAQDCVFERDFREMISRDRGGNNNK